MQATWKVHPADPQRAERLARALNLHPLTGQLLLNRGVHTAKDAARFLDSNLECLVDPNVVPDVARGVGRLRRAIQQREPILIFGDSDVDGLTSSVMLYEALRGFDAVVRARQSNRIVDGYGLPASLVRQVCRSSTKLVILVDCGTNQPEAIQQLASHGIDTIIVDHHVPLEAWAHPYALINPHRDPSGPLRELSSAGLALKLIQALVGGVTDARFTACLDLAALGLLADYAPLIGESRVIIEAGLARIVHSHRRGLRQLCEVTETTKADPEQIARRLVPRLNACGRLGDPGAVWRLLLSERDANGAFDEWMAQTQAAHAATKQLHRQIIPEAYEQVNRLNFRDQYVLVVSRSGWHQGLMGPLAAQLAQRYGRPTIAIAMDEQHGTGSGRSIPCFNLLDALKACQGLLVRFGGHAQACGLTVERKHLEPFRALVNQHAKAMLGRDGLMKTRMIDLELPLSELTSRWIEEAERFAPFGHGNVRPTVVIRGVTIETRSPRSAILAHGMIRLLGKGAALSDVTPTGRYDVVATPTSVEGVLGLTVSDVKGSTALSGLGQTSGS